MSDLRGNNVPGKIRTGSSTGIFAAIIVILAVGAAAGYAYETGQFKTAPKSVVSNSDLPQTPSGSGQYGGQ